MTTKKSKKVTSRAIDANDPCWGVTYHTASVDAAKFEQLYQLLPAGPTRTHVVAIKPANISVEQVLRDHGYAA